MKLKFEVQEAVHAILRKTKYRPKIALVLGSGLGPFAEEVEEADIIPYKDIPHFKVPSVHGHAGELVIGKIDGQEILVQKGRWHFYEGHSMNEVAFAVRVFATLGVETIILTNAAGGVNKTFKAGDLMVLTDHINMMGDNPLKGESAKQFGIQFPDMTEVYDKNLQKKLLQSDKKLKKGVYLALSGPNYETPAEVRMVKALGGDAVGMSTVPEAVAARHLNLKVAGISCITNLAAGISKNKLSHEEVKETADKSMKRFIKLLKTFLKKI